MAIELSFNEQERLIQQTARAFFLEHCPSSLVRDCERRPGGFAADLWAKMAEAGWLGMGFASEYDGLECGFLDLFALYVEIGRSLAPIPHLETVALAGALINELGDDAQKRAMLPGVASGRAICTLAMTEPESGFGADGIHLAATPTAEGFVLNGCKTLTPYAGSAERLICVARTGPVGADGLSLLLVDPRASGIEINHTPNISSYPLYTVTFRDVAVAKADLLGEQDLAWPALHKALMRAAVLQSAMVVGAGEQILAMSVDYAKTRRQFGEPIGKFQAVQYLATDIAFDLKSARLLALQAAWRIQSGRTFLREAALAKAAASHAAAAMTFAAHELHAGIGFMVDYDLQLYTRRAKHWESNLGDARYHLERVLTEDVPENGTLGGLDPLSAR